MGAAGVGLLVEAGVGGLFRVRDLVPGQPASRSALQVGDELQRIDGRDLLGMTLSQVFSLLTGSPGSSVSITARSAATRHKYVCKLVRQAAPKPAGPVSKPQAAAKAQGSVSPAVTSPSPSKEPSKFGSGPRLAWHADFREACEERPLPLFPREHGRNAEEEPARHDSNGDACALAQTNERLKAELLRTRQELLGAQEQQQAVEWVKGQHENAIALLKARVAELGEQLEFEKRRGSKWKVAALALPRLEEEFHSLSLSFRVSQVEFTGNLNNLMQQEQELRGILQHRLEHEQATVDSMVAVERKRLNEVRIEYEATRHEMEHLSRSMQLEIARQQESHEAAMSRAAHNSSDQEARFKALQAEIIQTLVARAEHEKQALLVEMQRDVEGILRNSRDLSCEIAMAIDSQREAERCFHVAFTLELRTLVSWVQSTQTDVTNLMHALASEPAPQVLHLQPDFEIDESFSPGVLERHMEDRLAELEHSFHLSTFDRDQQQKHSDRLANELTRLCTENLALQTAITTQQQQLHEKDKLIMVLQQVVQDANGSATRLSEELQLLQDEVVHLKQSYATELDALERGHLPQVRLAGEVAVEVSTSSQTISVSASRTTPTHIELSPSSLHGLRDNMPAPSRSPPTLSPDVSFFQRLRDPNSWDGNRTIARAQPLLQSPLFGIYPQSGRSPSAFLSSEQDGIQNDVKERSPVESTRANGQIFSETFSELCRSR